MRLTGIFAMALTFETSFIASNMATAHEEICAKETNHAEGIIAMVSCLEERIAALRASVEANRLEALEEDRKLVKDLADQSLSLFSSKVVFVTSDSFDGNLGGAEGADRLCQDAAEGSESIVPQGIYVAWISDGARPAKILRRSESPIRWPNGSEVIADSFDDLLKGSLKHPISMDENGAQLDESSVRVWTGIAENGTPKRDNCGGWKQNVGGRGTIGNAKSATSSWTNDAALSCDNLARLYCFEQ